MSVPHGQRGTALVEFTLVSTLLLFTILGVVEAGRLLFTCHLVSNAARLGTRYAMVRGDTCAQTLSGCTPASADDVEAYVRGASAGIDPQTLTVTTTWSNGAGCTGAPYQSAGCLVTVTASTTFRSPVPLLNLAAIPISSQSVMAIAQ